MGAFYGVISQNCLVRIVEGSFVASIIKPQSSFMKNINVIIEFPALKHPEKCDTLHDLVAFVQFKKREKHSCRSANFSKVAG